MAHRHVAETIELPDAKNRAVVVISDTHGRPHPSLFQILEKLHPSLILHAGDIGNLDLITELEVVAPTVYVRGNTDAAGPKWPDSVSLCIKLGAALQIDLLLVHFAVVRLRLNAEVISLLRQNPAQIVVYGHSHAPFLGKQQTTVLFNPGSAGPARMGLPITMGLIEISSQVRFKHLDLRTGEQWTPG
jgi:putative phosphoesterase